MTDTQPEQVRVAEEQVRADAADSMFHSTTSDLGARLMCRVDTRKLGLVLAHYDQLKSAAAELRRIRAVAASGTAESFLACDDDTKRLTFGLLCEESERRKSAESRATEAERQRDEAAARAERAEELLRSLRLDWSALARTGSAIAAINVDLIDALSSGGQGNG